MQNITKITIGIQARSTSKRFPRKVHEYLGGKTILMRTIDACKGSAFYLNQRLSSKGCVVDVALCVPSGDEIVSKYRGTVSIVEGSETDVLSRYVELANHYSSNYLVRITADCPLIFPSIISDHVICAVNKAYDYFSNVDEASRTSIDGMDVEVMSRKLLDHTNNHAKEPYDREHVTTFMRSNPPDWASVGFSMSHIDHSGIKLSVDTPDDLERIRQSLTTTQDKHRIAEVKYGKGKVHWI